MALKPTAPRTYLDASVLVALVITDVFTSRAVAFLRTTGAVPVISDFSCAECVSVIARNLRTGNVTQAGAHAALLALDAWVVRFGPRTNTHSADIAAADAFLRRFDRTLRTPDAIHIAIARRAGAALATFDTKMATSAHLLGIAIATL